MATESEACEVRLVAELAIPEGMSVKRVDVYDWLLGILGDWAMKAPQEPVTTKGTFADDGEKLRDREVVIDIIEARDGIGSPKAVQHK
jgi:hypothetical protein